MNLLKWDAKVVKFIEVESKIVLPGARGRDEWSVII